MTHDPEHSPKGQPPAAHGGEEAAAGLPERGESELYTVRVTPDRMAVLIDANTAGQDLEVLAEAIARQLVRYRVRRPPKQDAIVAWLREHTADSPVISGVALLRGTPPVYPVDGRIEWGGDFFNTGFVVDEVSGRIDFRQRAGEREVCEGQRLATVIPPVEGKNGMDVTGAVVRVKKPRAQRIRTGSHVREEAGTASYYATRDGRFRWNNGLLSVDEVYEIKGDIGLETGNVSHPGAVVVHRDIQEGSRLEAKGDVEVMGSVNRAHIQTTGMLIVRGGITGGEGVRIVASGGVRAKYILEADVTSNGDVVVEKEVMHANISTLGAVLIPQGRVIGGRVIARGGIDVGQAGSTASAATHLIAGEDYTIEGQLAILRARLARQRGNLEKIQKTFAGVRGKTHTLPESARQAIRLLSARIPTIQASIQAIKAEIDEVRADSLRDTNPVILIRRRLYSDTYLTVDGETCHVQEEVPGPVRPLVRDGRSRIVPTHLRTIKAPPEDADRDGKGAGSGVPPKRKNP